VANGTVDLIGALCLGILERLDLAQTARRLGYHRCWLAEHHSAPGLAGAAPEVLIAGVASPDARDPGGRGRRDAARRGSLKVVGSRGHARARRLALGAECGVDELVVVTLTPDMKARLRSYELAKAFGSRGDIPWPTARAGPPRTP
jgi:alkanesulfonate monooxygenase SsuD/methylene tetrahydromethanopterin reductase-like flavin-dependent oxidoreductase (luciferase family)